MNGFSISRADFLSYLQDSQKSFRSGSHFGINKIWPDLFWSQESRSINHSLSTISITTIFPNELLTGRYSLDPKNLCPVILAEAKAIPPRDLKRMMLSLLDPDRQAIPRECIHLEPNWIRF